MPWMRGAAAAAVALAGLACAGRGIVPREYVLVAMDAPAAHAAPLDVTVAIGPVELPGYLQRPQIVTRESGNRLASSDRNRWGESLEEGVTRVLAEDVALLVPTDRVVAFPWRGTARSDYRVPVLVERFERDPDGVVRLVARWAIVHRDEPPRARRSSLSERVEGSDPADTVDAMSRTVARLAREIAAEIRSEVGAHAGL
jgi:uncharacterized lipoprotein YmbA